MNINLLSSDPALSNGKLDSKGVSALTGDSDAFQKLLKYSEKEQLSSTQNGQELQPESKIQKIDGQLLDYKNRIEKDSASNLPDNHLPLDTKHAGKRASDFNGKTEQFNEKNRPSVAPTSKIGEEDYSPDVKSEKASKFNHNNSVLTTKAPIDKLDPKIASSLKEQPLTPESEEKAATVKVSAKLAQGKIPTSIEDESIAGIDPKLTAKTTETAIDESQSKLAPAIASTHAESKVTAEPKSKLKAAETNGLTKKSESTLKPASTATSKASTAALGHDPKLISESKSAEKMSDKKLSSELTPTADATILANSGIVTSGMPAVDTITEQSDAKIAPEPNSAALAVTAAKLTLPNGSIKELANAPGSKLTSPTEAEKSTVDTKLDSTLSTTGKNEAKKSEPNLATTSDQAALATATTTAVPASKSAEMTNAILQTIQSEKQNSDLNLTTTSTNHAVHQLNVPSQQQISTPTVSLPVPVSSPQWQDSFGQQIVMFSRQDIQKAEIRLHPEELGSLHIKLEMNDGKMQLQMASAHAAVRGILESAIPHLRTSLAEQGIDLQQADIGNSSMSDNANQQSMFSQQGRENSTGAQLSSNGDLEAIDNNITTGVTKQSGLSVFA